MTDSPEAKSERLSQFVEKTMQEMGVPGVAIGVLHLGETHTTGFGVTNVDHPLPVTDETLFQIGSITKTFTGTLVMRLVEEGVLDLDATVRSYLPEFTVADENASANATVRHLLTHMGGWVGDYFDDTGAGDDALERYVANMADLEQLAPLGTVWSYNNAGFTMAGAIIERVTGKPYQTVLQDMLLEPLDMSNSFLNPGDVMTHRFAVGHEPGPNGAQVARPWPLPRCVGPAGGIVCHVKDLLRYARFQLGDGSTADGTRLLSAESLARMQSAQVPVWSNESWGLTWSLVEYDGLRQVSHGGGTVGQVSLLSLIPEHEFAIAIFTNSGQGGALTQAVNRHALKEYLGVEPPLPTPVEASEEDLRPYVGRYRRPFAEIEIGLLGGRLVAQVTPKGGFPTKDTPPPPAPPPMTLALCEEECLLVMDGPMKDARGHVVRKPDGSIGWLRVGRIHVRQS